MTDLRKLADRLDDAYRAFIDGADDGDAFVAAYDHREDGYALATEAFAGPHEDEWDVIESGVNDAPQSARELVDAAAWFRLGELKVKALAPVRRAA